jgi:murein DD-endopeptidase MepM/ murein hydrolase activator NlpD
VSQKWTKFLAVILMLFFVAVVTVPALANDLLDLKKQQDVVKSKISNLKKEVTKVENKQKDVLTELAVIESELKKAHNELVETETKLRTTEQKLVATKKELTKAQEEVEQQQDTLNVRMRAMYKTGPVDYIEVLLASTDFSDFLTRLDMVKKIIDADKDLLMDFKDKKEEVEQKKLALEKQQIEIAQHKRAISTKKATIASRQGDRKRLLADLEVQKKEYERQEDKLEEDARRLANMIQQMQAKSKKPYVGTGAFQWPLPSSTRVTSEYGWRTHPIFKTKRFHEGIDIGAPTGSSVVSANNGVVIYAGSYGGYGNTIIVDHGGGMSSMYAHLSKILVKNGAEVKKGDKIGLVGSTGWSTGPHLHFGVMKNGQYTNPWNYLK